MDDFRCLSSLTEEEVLEIGYVLRELRRPGAREWKAISEAIGNHQSGLIWRYLTRYQLPEVLRIQGGVIISPLVLLLQSPYQGEENPDLFPPALS